MESIFNVQVLDSFPGWNVITNPGFSGVSISSTTQSSLNIPRHDTTHMDSKVVVEIDLAGVKKESISIVYDNDKKMLYYSGEYIKKQAFTNAVDPSYGNRLGGKFSYNIYVGTSADIGKCTATYDLGVLTVHLPLDKNKTGAISVK